MSQTTTSPSVVNKNNGHHVTSIVRDNGLHHHRELFNSDKNTLITSLNYNLSHVNNSSNGSTSNGNGNANGTASTSTGHHTYQNVSNFKQIQSMLQSTLNGNNQSNGSNGHHNHNHHTPSYHAGVAKVTAPSVPPPPPSTTPTPIVGLKTASASNGHNGTSNGVSTTTANHTNPTSSNTSTPAAVASVSNTIMPVLAKTKTLDGYVGFANLPNQVGIKNYQYFDLSDILIF